MWLFTKCELSRKMVPPLSHHVQYYWAEGEIRVESRHLHDCLNGHRDSKIGDRGLRFRYAVRSLGAIHPSIEVIITWKQGIIALFVPNVTMLCEHLHETRLA